MRFFRPEGAFKMKNQAFTQTTEAERLQKLDTAIRSRTNNALTDAQVQALVSSIGSARQHTLSVYTNPCDFSGALSSRRNEDDGKIVFGHSGFARSLMRNCYVGILKNPNEPSAAVIIQNTGDCKECAAHIYVPLSLFERGTRHE